VVAAVESIIARDVSLRSANAFGLDARAEYFAKVESPAALSALLASLADDQPVTVLGGGTNVVLKPWLGGCVIKLALRGIEARPDGSNDVLVTAAAGESWHGLVRYCLGQGLSGIENLALIPGSVGAAPMQNVGAYGMELSRCLDHVTALDRATGEPRTFRNSDCGFGYRDSVFKSALRDRFIIVSVTLRLRRNSALLGTYPDVQQEGARLGGPIGAVQVAEAVIRIRRRKLPDPRRIGNAGSFFKNPVVSAETFQRIRSVLSDLKAFPDAAGAKISAARLIDACGWKGRRHGRAAVWFRQPLVLVNTGDATAQDVLGLADAIHASVQARFGVALEREVQVLGNDR
jgi:UDP-N-acetylmuramate dehydrogenase